MKIGVPVNLSAKAYFCSALLPYVLDLGFCRDILKPPPEPGLDRSGSAFMWVVELRRGYVFLTIDDATMWMAPSPLMASEACPWRMSYLIRIGENVMEFLKGRMPSATQCNVSLRIPSTDFSIDQVINSQAGV